LRKKNKIGQTSECRVMGKLPIARLFNGKQNLDFGFDLATQVATRVASFQQYLQLNMTSALNR